MASSAGTEQTVTLGPMKISEKAEVGGECNFLPAVNQHNAEFCVT